MADKKDWGEPCPYIQTCNSDTGKFFYRTWSGFASFESCHSRSNFIKCRTYLCLRKTKKES